MFTGFSLHEKSFDFKSSEIYVFLSIYKHIHLRMEIESRYRIFSVITCFCHGKRWCIVCSPICEIKLPLNLQTVTKDSLKYGKMSTKSRAFLLFVQDQCQIVISVKNTQTYMRKKNELFIFRMSRLKYCDIFDQTDPGRKCIFSSIFLRYLFITIFYIALSTVQKFP